MIAAWLLALSSVDAVGKRSCAGVGALRSIDPATEGVPDGQPVRHVFQNGEAEPLRLFEVDRDGRRADAGEIAPGRFVAVRTRPGHVFVLTAPNGQCRAAVRVDGVRTGTFVGPSRYRRVPLGQWTVFVDRALDPATEPTRTALAVLGRRLGDAELALSPTALPVVHNTPIFVLDHAGTGRMFHFDPDWPVAHGRTAELAGAIEISDAATFATAPTSLFHELAHAYYARLRDADRAEIETAYRAAMTHGLYRSGKREAGVPDASNSASEYFAELSEAYLGRNDRFPFTRAELATYDPAGERLLARLWG